ncbi:MAG: ribose 5-phosphate isomerase A [Caldilineales bacterium]|nr:ribose 5-phosphate isomerase A [Caldilineales bacterium]
MPDIEQLKQQAAAQALEQVEDGMVLGLGSGSTSAYFVDLLGRRLQSGALRNIRGVPTSEKTAEQARRLGIPLSDLASDPVLDLAVDGADEVDPDLNLIKGLGKALLREKLVEIHARRLLIIVDESKISSRLGVRSPLPVEIVQFAAGVTEKWLGTLGCRAEIWLNETTGQPWVTDNGNYLVRCWFPDGVADPGLLATKLAERPGVVDHGLFLGMADTALVADSDGVYIMERKK